MHIIVFILLGLVVIAFIATCFVHGKEQLDVLNKTDDENKEGKDEQC